MDPLATSLESSPELFPFAFEPTTDQVTLIRLSEADYRRASFLDARVLNPLTVRRTVPWLQLEAAVAATRLEQTASYIFHIGHVGSTLLSRLLGAHRQVLALREPAILRTFAQMRLQPTTLPRWAEAEFERRLGTILNLLSRTFRPEQHAIIKATSFVSELAAQILALPGLPKAMFMFVSPETYLATILGAPNSPKEARLLAESRLTRLHMRTGQHRWGITESSEGEMVAMSWACEMTALAAAAEEARERVSWLNFERLLEDPAACLTSAFRHFGIAAEADLETILSGPELRRYAKAPEHAYGPVLRNEILEQSRREHAGEIARGLAWLDLAGKQSAAITAALNMQ
jgi:hypothetical protein